MEGNVPITPSEDDPEFLKTGRHFKKLNQEICLQSEKELKEIETLIKDAQAEIISQKERIDKLKGRVKIYEEGDEIELQDAEDLLRWFENDLKESLEIKKTLMDLITETTLSEAEISIELEEVENEINKFKENLLKRKNSEN